MLHLIGSKPISFVFDVEGAGMPDLKYSELKY
jgi:hypothetical protein